MNNPLDKQNLMPVFNSYMWLNTIVLLQNVHKQIVWYI